MILSDEQIQQIQGVITNCIDQLYLNDAALINRRGMERSASFRFAVYLHDSINEIEWLNGLQVDIEYNKNGLIPKRIPRRPNGVRPDLIIHSRGNNDANMLVVEIKGWWNNKPRENDRIKLEDFTSEDGEYKYGLGVFLDLGRIVCVPEYIKLY